MRTGLRVRTHIARGRVGIRVVLLLRDSVAVASCDPPLAGFSAVGLGGAERVGARFAVDRDAGVFERGGVGHVADDVVGQEVNREGHAVAEVVREVGEEVVDLLLAEGVAPGAQDADRLVA